MLRALERARGCLGRARAVLRLDPRRAVVAGRLGASALAARAALGRLLRGGRGGRGHGRHRTVEGGLRPRVHVLEPVVVALAVDEARVAVAVAAAERRGAHARDQRSREPRPRAVARVAAVEVEALVVELGAGLPGELDGGVLAHGLERLQLDLGRDRDRRVGRDREALDVLGGAVRLDVGRRQDRRRHGPGPGAPRPGAQVVGLVLDHEVDHVARVALDLDPVRLVEVREQLLDAPGNPAVGGQLVLDAGRVAVDEDHAARAAAEVPGEVERAVAGRVAVSGDRLHGEGREHARVAVVARGVDALVVVLESDEDVVAVRSRLLADPADHVRAAEVGQLGVRAPAAARVPDPAPQRRPGAPDRQSLARVGPAQDEVDVEAVGRDERLRHAAVRAADRGAQQDLRAEQVRGAVPDPGVDRGAVVRDAVRGGPDQGDLVRPGPRLEPHPAEHADGVLEVVGEGPVVDRHPSEVRAPGAPVVRVDVDVPVGVGARHHHEVAALLLVCGVEVPERHRSRHGARPPLRVGEGRAEPVVPVRPVPERHVEPSPAGAPEVLLRDRRPARAVRVRARDLVEELLPAARALGREVRRGQADQRWRGPAGPLERRVAHHARRPRGRVAQDDQRRRRRRRQLVRPDVPETGASLRVDVAEDRLRQSRSAVEGGAAGEQVQVLGADAGVHEAQAGLAGRRQAAATGIRSDVGPPGPRRGRGIANGVVAARGVPPVARRGVRAQRKAVPRRIGRLGVVDHDVVAQHDVRVRCLRGADLGVGLRGRAVVAVEGVVEDVDPAAGPGAERDVYPDGLARAAVDDVVGDVGDVRTRRAREPDALARAVADQVVANHPVIGIGARNEVDADRARRPAVAHLHPLDRYELVLDDDRARSARLVVQDDAGSRDTVVPVLAVRGERDRVRHVGRRAVDVEDRAGGGVRARLVVNDADLAPIARDQVAVRHREAERAQRAARDAVLPRLQRRELARHRVGLAPAARAREGRRELQLRLAVDAAHHVVRAVDQDAVAAAAVGALPARARARDERLAVRGGAGAAAGGVGRGVSDRAQVAGAGPAGARVDGRAGRRRHGERSRRVVHRQVEGGGRALVVVAGRDPAVGAERVRHAHLVELAVEVVVVAVPAEPRVVGDRSLEAGADVARDLHAVDQEPARASGLVEARGDVVPGAGVDHRCGRQVAHLATPAVRPPDLEHVVAAVPHLVETGPVAAGRHGAEAAALVRVAVEVETFAALRDEPDVLTGVDATEADPRLQGEARRGRKRSVGDIEVRRHQAGSGAREVDAPPHAAHGARRDRSHPDGREGVRGRVVVISRATQVQHLAVAGVPDAGLVLLRAGDRGVAVVERKRRVGARPAVPQRRDADPGDERSRGWVVLLDLVIQPAGLRRRRAGVGVLAPEQDVVALAAGDEAAVGRAPEVRVREAHEDREVDEVGSADHAAAVDRDDLAACKGRVRGRGAYEPDERERAQDDLGRTACDQGMQTQKPLPYASQASLTPFPIRWNDSSYATVRRARWPRFGHAKRPHPLPASQCDSQAPSPSSGSAVTPSPSG